MHWSQTYWAASKKWGGCLLPQQRACATAKREHRIRPPRLPHWPPVAAWRSRVPQPTPRPPDEPHPLDQHLSAPAKLPQPLHATAAARVRPPGHTRGQDAVARRTDAGRVAALPPGPQDYPELLAPLLTLLSPRHRRRRRKLPRPTRARTDLANLHGRCRHTAGEVLAGTSLFARGATAADAPVHLR